MLVHTSPSHSASLYFFFNDTATTEIYTLSLHDALPIFDVYHGDEFVGHFTVPAFGKHNILNALGVIAVAYFENLDLKEVDRKSTRLNSSHSLSSRMPSSA